MKNGNDYKMEENPESPEIYAAKLSLVGTTLSTLGDALQTIAAGITLQELEKTNNQNSQDSQDSQNQSDQSNKLENMQRQIDQLTRKIERMDRRNK